MRLLLIEDNVDLAALLAQSLAPRGFTSDVTHTAENALEMLDLIAYDGVVLDLGLPDMNGLALLRQIRRRKSSPPVLVLTARGAVDERVAGLEAGADDYVVKPFSFEEVVARLNVILRGRGRGLAAQLRVGDVTLDPVSRETEVAGVPAIFSAQELNILEMLMRRAGRVVPKRYLDEQLFGLNAGLNALEVAVYRLRKRLEQVDAKVEIHTIRGVGYLIDAKRVSDNG